MRAFLVKAQQALSGNKRPVKGIPAALLQPFQSTMHSPAPGNHSSSSASGRPYTPQSTKALPSTSTPWSTSNPTYNSPHSPSPSHGGQYAQNPGSTASLTAQKPGAPPLHPAIRPQYGQPWRSPNDSPAPGQAVPRPRPQARPQPQATAFSKQSHSPIPLPPYVRQSSQPGPVMQQPQQAAASSPTGQSPSSAGDSVTAPSVTASQTQRPNQANHAGQNDGQAEKQALEPASAATGPAPTESTSEGVPALPSKPGSHDPQNEQRPPVIAGQDSADSPGISEFPDVPADSMALVERMMLNLRRASQHWDVAA